MKCDELKEVEYPIEWGLYYDKEKADAAIAELKDKIQMHDFFWEGCGFAKRGFKNAIAVSEAFDRLEAENAELKQKLSEKDAEIESLKASHYAEMVDAGMRERRLNYKYWDDKADEAAKMKRLIQNGEIIYLDEYCNEKDWRIMHKVWEDEETKCRAKAEQYK